MKRLYAAPRRDGSFAAAVTLAFLLGCFPSGRVVARLFLGPRARLLGDGSLGASRVAREVGKEAGLLVFVLDAAKGALPVLWARRRGLGPARRGPLGFAPLLAIVFVKRGRGAASAAGTALVEDPEALGLVAPILTGGLLARRHAPSVFIAYLLLAPARALLGRERAAVAWTAASMGLLILARARGTGAGRLSAPLLRERLWYDRELLR